VIRILIADDQELVRTGFRLILNDEPDLQVIAPEQFEFSVSIFVLSMIILGGMGNIAGVLVGGLLLGGFDRVLTPAISHFIQSAGTTLQIGFLADTDVSKAKTLIFGIILVVMMLVRPEGLIPSARRKMELHEGEPVPDAARGVVEELE